MSSRAARRPNRPLQRSWPNPGLWQVPLLVLGLVLAPMGASAQPGEKTRARAVAHYEAGAKAFRDGDYETAIAEYLAAIELLPKPALLFNIARAYHLAGHEAKAIEYYHSYIEKGPDGTVKDEARQFLAELEAQLEHTAPDDTEAKDPAKSEPARPELDVSAPRPESEDGLGLRITGWSLVGLGVAAGAVGVYFGLDARSQSQELSGWSDTWPEDLQTRIDAGERSQTLCISLSVAGVGLLAAGAGLLWWERSDREKQRLSVVPEPGGARVTWQVRY